MSESPLLQLAGPETPFPPGSVTLSMWETSRLSPKAVANLNRARCVVVPCRANAEWFRESGVAVPIRVVPLGIDPAVYHPSWPEPSDLFVVHASMRVWGGGHRKGFDDVVAAFVGALGDREDCRLRIKVFSGCPVIDPGHPRIAIDRTAYEDPGLANFYRMATVGISMSRSEGWGMTPLEQMGCGRPVIAPIHSGMAEYLTPANCYPVEFDEEPAHGLHYEGLGHWYKPRVESAIEQLRLAYANPSLRRRKGEEAARTAAGFSWKNAGMLLAEVLREFGLAERPKSAVAPLTPVREAIATQKSIRDCSYRIAPTCGCPGAEATCTKPGQAGLKVLMPACQACVRGGGHKRTKAITFTAYKRPAYLKQALDTLSRCDGIGEYLLLPHVEPGCPETRSLIEGITFAECKPAWNSRKLGCTPNVRAALDHAFSLSDFAIYLDEDVVLSRDALRFYEWAAIRYRDDATVGTATAYHRNPDATPDAPLSHAAGRLAWFHPVTFGTWRDRWEMVRPEIVDTPGKGIWDYAMVQALVTRRGRVEVHPLLGRADHIGLETSLQDAKQFPPEFYESHHSAVHWAGLGPIDSGEWHEASP